MRRMVLRTRPVCAEKPVRCDHPARVQGVFVSEAQRFDAGVCHGTALAPGLREPDLAAEGRRRRWHPGTLHQSRAQFLDPLSVRFEDVEGVMLLESDYPHLIQERPHAAA